MIRKREPVICGMSGIEIPPEDAGGCNNGEYCDYCAYNQDPPVDVRSENLTPVIVISLIIAMIVLLIMFYPGAR